MAALQAELGRPLRALQDMPALSRHLNIYFEAFDLLSPARPVNFGGVGLIPLRDILSYLDWQSIRNRDEQLKWIRYLQAMDSEYLSFANIPEVK